MDSSHSHSLLIFWSVRITIVIYNNYWDTAALHLKRIYIVVVFLKTAFY